MNIQKLGHSLAGAARWQERYLCLYLEPYGLSPRTLPFYMTIAHNEGISQKELMNHMLTDKTRTTKAVNHLVMLGFAERKKNNDDHRLKGVILTRRGRDILPEIEKVLKRLDRILSGKLTEDETKNFIFMLDAFSEAVQRDMEQ
jgi:DNA-binding MarR family transcriptional regulator